MRSTVAIKNVDCADGVAIQVIQLNAQSDIVPGTHIKNLRLGEEELITIGDGESIVLTECTPPRF